MRLPDFTAEFSLYKSTEPYRVSQTMTRSGESLHLAQFGEIPIPGGSIPGGPIPGGPIPGGPIPGGPIPGGPIPGGPIIIPPICFPFCQQFCFGFPPRCFTLCRRICF